MQTKLKNLFAKTEQLKPQNKIKQNCAKNASKLKNLFKFTSAFFTDFCY